MPGTRPVWGTPNEITRFARWFGALPHKHKIFVPGNHDWLFEKNESEARKIFETEAPGTVVLINEQIEVAYLSVYGSPYQPDFCGWAFNLPRGGLGCADLGLRLIEVKPLLHVFGHIHDSYGQYVIGATLHVNAATCNEGYQPVNKPIVVNLYETARGSYQA